MHWTNERAVPQRLIELIDIAEIPNELRAEIMRASDEVEKQGAVSYPTKARVEYYLHKYQDLLDTLLEAKE